MGNLVLGWTDKVLEEQLVDVQKESFPVFQVVSTSDVLELIGTWPKFCDDFLISENGYSIECRIVFCPGASYPYTRLVCKAHGFKDTSGVWITFLRSTKDDAMCVHLASYVSSLLPMRINVPDLCK